MIKKNWQKINICISAIFSDGELDDEATHKKFLLVRTEGKRQVKRNIDHYNLDMIIVLGYSVAAKPPVRPGVSHKSGQAEPLICI